MNRQTNHGIRAHDSNHLTVSVGTKPKSTRLHRRSKHSHCELHAIYKFMERSLFPRFRIDVQRVIFPMRLIWTVEEQMIDIHLWRQRNFPIKRFEIHGRAWKNRYDAFCCLYVYWTFCTHRVFGLSERELERRTRRIYYSYIRPYCFQSPAISAVTYVWDSGYSTYELGFHLTC